MTINSVCNSLYNLSVGGYFNREKFTKSRLKNLVNSWFKDGSKIIVIEIALPDGWWPVEIYQFAPSEFDYYIPDTQEQADSVWRRLKERYNASK